MASGRRRLQFEGDTIASTAAVHVGPIQIAVGTENHLSDRITDHIWSLRELLS
jgi:hypothetical protein